jgi:predicted ATPase
LHDGVEAARNRGRARRAGPVEAVHGASSGNPFFVRGLLLHLVREGRLERDAVGRWTSRFTLDEMRIPQSVRALLDQRLGRVSEEVRRLLSAASAWEGGFPFEVAWRAAGLEDDAALDALDEALQAQLVWAPDADRTSSAMR